MKNLEKPFIRRFIIKKLFGVYDVDIPFDDSINIFIGENGIGKTTIMNCINYVLNMNYSKLYEIDFEEIEVFFTTKKCIKINHNDLDFSKNFEFDSRRMRSDYFLNSNINMGIIKQIIIKYLKEQNKKESIEKNFYENIELIDYIIKELEKNYDVFMPRFIIKRIIEENHLLEQNTWEELIIEKTNENRILFLPTYRRIEKDFEILMNKKYLEKEWASLNFGMKDVKELIEKKCNSLISQTSEGFKEMTNNLLMDCMDIIDNKYKPKIETLRIDEFELDVILERLANVVNIELKDKIITLLKNKPKTAKDYKYLYSILSNLIEITKKTKKLDESLLKFTKVCNSYLENKKFEYNPYKVECNLIRENSDDKIILNKLSSGEKQIISLFANIYLSEQEKNIILFDEPELSLSIIWQKKLIPDLVESGKCNFLIAITHSPFIFDNDYKYKARDIKTFIKEVKE